MRKYSNVSILICLLSIYLPCNAVIMPDVSGVTGARINESDDNVAHIIHVSINGNDSSGGSEAEPLRTINKAAEIAGSNQQNHEGTRILIHPGTYRESVDALMSYPLSGSVGAPIIFEAIEEGTVIVSGSEIYTDWQSEQGTDVYSHYWEFDWELWVDIPEAGAQYEKDVFINNPILRRREMFFADRELMMQVLSYNELERMESSFYVDEANDKVYVHLVSGSDINSVTIEAAERMYLLRTYRNRSIVVRGLVFEHATNAVFGDGAVSFEESKDILFEYNNIRWCNGNGWSFSGTQVVGESGPSIYYPSERLTVRKNISNYNGIAGGETFLTRNTIFEGNQTSYNNWRGEYGDLSWGWTGTRFYLMHDSIVRDHKSVGNFARGLWFDTDADNVLLEGAYLCENIDGVKFEVCQGPILVRNCDISRNSRSGILFHVDRGVMVEGCNIVDNDYYQLEVSSSQVSRYLTDWYLEEPAGFLNASYISFSRNVIGGCGSQNLVYIPDFTPFKSTFASDDNYYYHTDRSDVFAINSINCPSCTPLIYAFSSWQAVSAVDANSGFNNCAPVPSYCGDFGTLYHQGDMNLDCNVDFVDFSELANSWMLDTRQNSSLYNFVIEPMQDTTFNSLNYNSNVGGTAIGLENWIYNGGGVEKRCSLMKFDVGSIDADRLQGIIDAKLFISANMYGSSGKLHGWNFHRMLVPWDESSTYNQLRGLRAGYQYDTQPFCTYIHDGNNDPAAIYIDGFGSAVEKWVNGTWENHGFVIISYPPAGPTFNVVGFRSREFVQYPNLNPLLFVAAEVDSVCGDNEANWNQDLNGNCVIELGDIAILIQNWLYTFAGN